MATLACHGTAGRDRPAPAASLGLLMAVAASGTMAMHAFVPILAVAAVDLRAEPSRMQLAISLYMLGLAAGHLAWGPLSDRLGRRPALLAGLALYAAAAASAALAASLEALVAARFLQAFGGCAGLVIGRAVVRDTSGREEAAGRLAGLNLALLASPALAPLCGDLLAAHLGWRGTAWALAAFGAAVLLATSLLLPETRSVRIGSMEAVARRYAALLGSVRFVTYVLAGAAATTTSYSFVAAMPFLFGELGGTSQELALWYAGLFGAIACGSALAGRLVRRAAVASLLLAGLGVALAGATAYLLIELGGHRSIGAVMAAMTVFLLGCGLASPMALATALEIDATAAGSASGAYGFGQMAIGAASAALAGTGRDPSLAAALILTATTLAAIAAVLLDRLWSRQSPATP